MSQEDLQTMIMQNFWGVKEVYYGIVQVVNSGLRDCRRQEPRSLSAMECGASVYGILGSLSKDDVDNSENVI